MKVFSKFALSSSVGNRGSGLGFGCMGITAFYGSSLADEKALELLKSVYNAGCRHFDTAEIYATKEKHNEHVLGMFLRTVPRDSFSVATKFWPGETNCDYETVKSHLQKSLERLGLDYVDLYYMHRVPSLDKGLAFARAAAQLKQDGLIREVGLSEVGPSWLRKIHTEACPIDAVQLEWSLLTRNAEQEVIPLCKELDIAVVAYSPLARNLLASKIQVAPDDWRGNLPRYAPENLAKNQEIADIVASIGQANHNATAAQVALAWLFHRAHEMGVTVVPIPGSTKLPHALGNLQAANVQLSKDDVQVLESLADQVAGARGTEGYIQAGFESHK